MNQSIYQYKKSAFIRPIRVIRVPLASIRLCLLSVLLLLPFAATAGDPLTGIWESPDKQHNDPSTAPKHSFGSGQDIFQSGFEPFSEGNTYNQKDLVLRAGGQEDGGDPTKLPVGSVPVWLFAGISVLYVLIIRIRKYFKLENVGMKARKGKARM